MTAPLHTPGVSKLVCVENWMAPHVPDLATMDAVFGFNGAGFLVEVTDA